MKPAIQGHINFIYQIVNFILPKIVLSLKRTTKHFKGALRPLHKPCLGKTKLLILSYRLRLKIANEALLTNNSVCYIHK